jgi:hypothetical protein
MTIKQQFIKDFKSADSAHINIIHVEYNAMLQGLEADINFVNQHSIYINDFNYNDYGKVIIPIKDIKIEKDKTGAVTYTASVDHPDGGYLIYQIKFLYYKR